MISFDRATALIVVDMQNDFAAPAGSLFVGGAPEVVAEVNALVAAATAAGAFVVYTADWHPAETPHFAKDGGTWPVHCVGDSWGAEFHPDLALAGPVVRKGSNGEDGYSGFTMRDPVTRDTAPTELVSLLEEAGVERVVVCGLATDYCVKATVLDALDLGYPVVVPRAAIASVDLEPGDGVAALLAMCMAGASVL